MWIELTEYVKKYESNIEKKDVFLINPDNILYIQSYQTGEKIIVRIDEDNNEVYTEKIKSDIKYFRIILNDKNYSQFIIDEADYQKLKDILINQKTGWKD